VKDCREIYVFFVKLYSALGGLGKARWHTGVQRAVCMQESALVIDLAQEGRVDERFQDLRAWIRGFGWGGMRWIIH